VLSALAKCNDGPFRWSAAMADEVLLKEPLTDQMIREGEALTRQLDDMGVPLTVVLALRVRAQ